MLPNIDTKSAIKKNVTVKNVTLSTTNNTKNNPTSTYCYKIKTTPKQNK